MGGRAAFVFSFLHDAVGTKVSISIMYNIDAQPKDPLPDLLCLFFNFSSLAFLRSSFSFSFCCLSCCQASIMCMFSTLVNTFPEDFWCFVGSLLGGIGVVKTWIKFYSHEGVR